jgi:hypothetical protein
VGSNFPADPGARLDWWSMPKNPKVNATLRAGPMEPAESHMEHSCVSSCAVMGSLRRVGRRMVMSAKIKYCSRLKSDFELSRVF